jgi:acyl carrier protein
MNDTRRRLLHCFTSVFEGFTEEQLAGASVSSLEGWDSVAMVTLVSVVEEEFQVRVKSSDLGELTSFDSFCRYVDARARET